MCHSGISVQVIGGQDEGNNVEYSSPAVMCVCIGYKGRCERVMRDSYADYPTRAEFRSDVEAPGAGEAPVPGP